MEPLTSVAIAIASLVLTKNFEKIGEQVGDRAYETAGKKLLEVMRKKYPEVVEKDLQGQSNYRETLIEIETVAERDPEIAEAVINLGEAIKSESNQEILLQVLNNVVNITMAENNERYLQSNISNNNQTHYINNINSTRENLTQQSFIKRYSSMIIGFYFSFLFLILIGLLVFVPLSIAIQQVLVALIAIFVVFSLSAFKRYAKYTAN
ncbi:MULTISPECIES: hypothetical protein [unclassified Tolypothrix]|uniref:hypothetical protein n=1 Tax=unclassified Tolypothrix TaxID=2649714 RepID=UPI0005EAB745|nr:MULTISPECIES: hypothetical protein [unclassified Tolypothrix]BAY95773.1 hypothetical protein NIES3275_78500 [Microchaete diplosiphon NIES-3275]EKE98202.1 hypothetical protein FDUTEX481_04219 [Tolypothrix sp. PCC 7601]MBE9087472.1 hypothetical protein [Tolypothrix sp. LEGE 11397]UYD30784.1 hypothetical protein HGR01_38760 [Tolypothrix sp. PCC 7712]UYD38702.1 hypothetical protein HG267_40190 [Tolypothrix sp. PCC 7601]